MNFCGRDIEASHTGYKPKSVLWDSMDFLSGITRSDIILPQEYLDEKQGFFFHATYTEHDAENLCKHIDALPLDFSPEFRAFEKVWRRDEWNHYVGFRQLYSIMYGEPVESVAKQIEERPYDFSPIGEYFKDEFTICLLIAFDEILTTKGYATEHALYASLGPSGVSEWFKQVTRDEAYHFKNAMEVIRVKHSHRRSEISEVVNALITLDTQSNDYKGTFVLDHELYSKKFIVEGASILMNYFL